MSRKAGLPFARLSAQAKARALDWGRRCVSEHFDADRLTEDLQEYVKEKHGLDAKDCYWSLSYCDCVEEEKPIALAVVE